MAALLFVLSVRNLPAALLEPVEPVLRRAMQERCPGPITRHDLGNAWCLVTEHDGGTARDGDLWVALDGHPRLAMSGARPGEPTAAVGVAAAWRSSGQAILSTLDGGFSLCAYDCATGQLVLARDRFGARPLFWVRWNGLVVAASECKILAALGVPLRVSRRALQESLVCRWLQTDQHLLAPIQQVPAASCVTVDSGGNAATRRYWVMPFAPEPGGPEAMDHYRDQAREAMQLAVIGAAAGRDSVGVLLSGGVDSSVIAGVARETVKHVIGYTARIPNAPNPELDRALIVARHLGVECRIVDVEVPDFSRDVHALVRRLEEPPRQPNNFVLEQLFRRAAQDVDVVLQGDAAEMMFGLADVQRVAQFRRKHAMVGWLPQSVRRSVARTLWGVDDGWADRLARILAWDPLMFAAMLDAVQYSPGVQRSLLKLIYGDPPDFLPMQHFADHQDFVEALQAYQAYTFMAVSLVRHDRLASPLGLTSESPFLRAPVVAFAGRLPRALRYHRGSKPVLRALCDHYLPAEVSRWPKMGFPVPWEAWLRSALPDGVRSTPFLQAVLPPGFLDAANAVGDADGMWTAMTLDMLADEFCVMPEVL